MTHTLLPVERVIGESGLAASADGLRLDMRLPWYRSLPLSTVRVEALSLDGAPVDLADALFELDGRRWPLAALADEIDSFWFVLDSAFLILPQLHPAPGSRHEVALTLAVFPPYIPGMKRANSQTATLAVA
ncbi:MAG TPA: DUF6379 domain-containing protein [Novosphingobium sp.]|nr:DUF6379 domain-containing protein [Novosphingobium sp.]HZV10191.1 DUF6379 domain-containing protein [Novosphingobium sp.]